MVSQLLLLGLLPAALVAAAGSVGAGGSALGGVPVLQPLSSLPDEQMTIIDVDVANVTNPRVLMNIRGCHADLGFSSLPTFFSANMVYEPAFGLGTMKVPPWFARSLDGGTVGPVTRSFVCPTVTDSLAVKNDTTLVNRGLGGVGMSLIVGREYEFEAYGRYVSLHRGQSSVQDRKVYAELRDSKSGKVLARQEANLSSFNPDVYLLLVVNTHVIQFVNLPLLLVLTHWPY